jgi:pimeloyl-ACP methyl ester carboxylesterase
MRVADNSEKQFPRARMSRRGGSSRWIIAILSVLMVLEAHARPDTFQHRTVTARDGVPLHVVIAGDERKPAILFLHDAGQSYLSWTGQLEDSALARRFCLVALDLRGHGASGKPWSPNSYAGSKPWGGDVRSVIDALGIHDVVLVGWKFGADVASAYVAEYGTASLSGIVMVGGAGGLLGVTTDLLPPTSEDLQEYLRSGRQYTRSLTARPAPESIAGDSYASFLMVPPYVRRAVRAARSDYSDVTSRIDVPLLVVAGSGDASLPANAAADLASRRPAAQVIRYPGVGRSPFIESSAKFNADLGRFGALATARTAVGTDDARILAAARIAERFRAALAGGDAEATLQLYSDEVVMERNRGRPPVRGRETMRPTDEFHAVVRPQIRYIEPKFIRSGERVVLSTAGSVEATHLFEAMGLPVVVTLPVQEALVIENEKVVAMREAEFRPACQRVISHATSATLDWLRASGDPRLENMVPSGVPRIAGDTASLWVESIRDWSRASGYKPSAEDVADCVAGTAGLGAL